MKQTAMTEEAERHAQAAEADIVAAEKVATAHGGKMALLYVHLTSAIVESVMALACQVADVKDVKP